MLLYKSSIDYRIWLCRGLHKAMFTRPITLRLVIQQLCSGKAMHQHKLKLERATELKVMVLIAR